MRNTQFSWQAKYTSVWIAVYSKHYKSLLDLEQSRWSMSNCLRFLWSLVHQNMFELSFLSLFTKVYPLTKYQGCRSNGSSVRDRTGRQADRQTDRQMASNYQVNSVHASLCYAVYRYLEFSLWPLLIYCR